MHWNIHLQVKNKQINDKNNFDIEEKSIEQKIIIIILLFNLKKNQELLIFQI